MNEKPSQFAIYRYDVFSMDDARYDPEYSRNVHLYCDLSSLVALYTVDFSQIILDILVFVVKLG